MQQMQPSPAHARPPRSLRAEFSFALQYLARSWRRMADADLAALGLSDATAWALINLERLGEGIRQTTLADSLGIEGSSLVRLLDTLCAAGLVERREDPSDRRAKTLYLTAAGRDVHAAMQQRLEALRARILAEVDETELQATLALIGRLQGAVDTELRAELVA